MVSIRSSRALLPMPVRSSAPVGGAIYRPNTPSVEQSRDGASSIPHVPRLLRNFLPRPEIALLLHGRRCFLLELPPIRRNGLRWLGRFLLHRLFLLCLESVVEPRLLRDAEHPTIVDLVQLVLHEAAVRQIFDEPAFAILIPSRDMPTNGFQFLIDERRQIRVALLSCVRVMPFYL